MFLRARDWTEDERQCDQEPAGQASDDDWTYPRCGHDSVPCASGSRVVSHWCTTMAGATCPQASHVQASAQLHFSPHRHDAARQPSFTPQMAMRPSSAMAT